MKIKRKCPAAIVTALRHGLTIAYPSNAPRVPEELQRHARARVDGGPFARGFAGAQAHE